MLRVRFFFPLLIVLAATAAACGGGGGGSVIPSPTATPHAGPTTIPVGPTPDVVNLSGDGYTLQFTVPPVVTGTTATMSAALQTALPSGTVAPNVGANVKGLVYLIVSTTASIGFSSAPSFQFTMPSGTTIASGSSAYLLFWDPKISTSGGWVTLLGPGTVNGQVVTFPGVKTGVNLDANTQYIYALAITTAPVPTATPAPTPTPTPAATATPAALPADCPTTFVSASGGIPLQITDDSGLSGAQLIVYATSTSNNEWLSYDGTFDSAAAVPMPAACFSTTTGSPGKQPLNIPSGSIGGHIYFVYAPYTSGSTTIPNPFSGVPISGQNPGYAAYHANPYPWDFIEYGTAKSGTTIDTTQVVSLGLPLELSTGATPLPVTTAGPMPVAPVSGTPVPCPTNGPAAQIVGVTSCNFANVFLALESISQYKNLVVAQPFGTTATPYDTQIVSPGYGQFTSFDWNLFADSLPAPTPAVCPSPATYGYLSCVLVSYQNTPRLFTSVVSGAGSVGAGPDHVTGDNYCVTSDGAANFEATDVGPNGTCTSTPNPTGTPYPFHINVANFMYGIPPENDNGGTANCKGQLLYGQPWGLADINGTSEAIATGNASGHLFAFDDAFALWKALSADLVYGTAMATPPPPQTHPIAPSGASAIRTTLFQDSMYDEYDSVLHTYFDSNLAYGLPYDDTYKLESGVLWNITTPVSPIDVRINQIPVAAGTLPASVSPVAMPSPCPALTPAANMPIGEF